MEPNAAGSLIYATDEEKIQQAVLVILGTTRGERVMRPDFGRRRRELVFAPLNSSTKGLVASAITDALVKCEPRVDVLEVQAAEQVADPGTLVVNIEYRVRATNSVFNLVYPFYLREGSNGTAQAS